MEYVVLSAAVVDDLILPDGTEVAGLPGGAGQYALAGARLWADDVVLVSGVGADFHDLQGAWYQRNKLHTGGLLVKDAQTPRTQVRYHADGERVETPLLGAGHFKKLAATLDDAAPFYTGAKGVYIFKNLDVDFWRRALQLRKQHGFKLMWEIAADATLPQNLSAVRSIARELDMFSINRAEAAALLGTEDTGEMAEALLGWGVPTVFLRLGTEGVFALWRGRGVCVPSAGGLPVVDVTGGGNSFSGGALVGWCETGDTVRAACMGHVSAAVAIAQYGPPPLLDMDLRRTAAGMAERLYNKAGQNGRCE